MTAAIVLSGSAVLALIAVLCVVILAGFWLLYPGER